MGLNRPLESSAEEVRALLAPLRNDFTVALHAADNAFAVGAIIRVAHNFLAREIVLIGGEPYYQKASMGMEKYETIVRVPHDEAFLDYVGERPLWAFEKESASVSLYSVSAFPRDVILLFGSERFGIPPALVDRADVVLAIPIYGVNNSLPLAVAAGIAMNEWARSKFSRSVLLP